MNRVTAQRPAEPVRACDIEPGSMIWHGGHAWMLLADFDLSRPRFDQDHRFVNLTDGHLLFGNGGMEVEPLYPTSVVTITVESVLTKV